MKTEKPIIFNGPMVRAILDGRKTQTRRVMKAQPPDDEHSILTVVSTTGDKRQEGKHHWAKMGGPDGLEIVHDQGIYFPCPYPVGTKLWVRETWAAHGMYVSTKPSNAQTNPKLKGDHLWYRADGVCIADGEEAANPPAWIGKWRPSIFMPKWAARLWNDVTKVRVERVQDISEEDAKAEGVGMRLISDPANPDTIGHSYRCPFADLWDSINAKRPGCSWADNPFCWVYDFERSKP